MRFSAIASGSSGNCIYVGSDTTHVLVDVGISKKRTEEALNSLELSLKDIDAIMITHEHSDHIQGLGVISRKYNIPIMTTKGTISAIKNIKSLGRIDDDLFVEIAPDNDFMVGNLKINPFKISHDAAQPVAYRIENDDKSVAIATDLGNYDDYIVSNLTGLDTLLIEANHDVNMLLSGKYPFSLKKRILGDYGHLSNERSGQLLDKILNDKMKHIFLGHLSKDNNFEELASQTVKNEISFSDSIYKADDFDIRVAKRDVCSGVVMV